MTDMTDFVAAALVEDSVITPEQLQRARRAAVEQGRSVTDALIAEGAVTESRVAIARAVICECPYADLSRFEIDLDNAALLPRSFAQKHDVFPLFRLGSVVTVGMRDPLDLAVVDRLRALLNADVDTVLCEAPALRQLIDRAYSMTGGASGSTPAVTEAVQSVTDDEPVVAAVNHIMAQAVEQGASDVHLNPDDRALHLRYRIDGVLQPFQGPPPSTHPALVQRIKVMASLDLTQTRRPQDGKFRFHHAGRTLDVRVSIIPTVYGENVVLRLLSGSAARAGFEDLGFSRPMRDAIEELIRRPHGLLLATGPTGSGKTTTLYAALSRLNSPSRNIVTVEDPVEYRMPMVRHIQVNAEIGLSFAGALRSILRHDPNVILVGEIRDEETARIAVQAALTGHLVLSTLHTNDASGTIVRLRDFHCPGFAINGALLGAVGQRLVRRVCADCAAPDTPEPAVLRHFARSPADSAGGQFRRGRGCARCMNTGLRGRLGVYELLRMTPAVQAAVERGAAGASIRKIAVREGMVPLAGDGFDKARLGLTPLDEVMRVAVTTFDTGAEDAPDEPMRLSA